MYQELENWKQYKQEKALQAKIAEEFKLKETIKLAKKKEWDKEMDKFMNKLAKKNGTTNY